MIRRETGKRWRCNTCAVCGATLTNPGYNKQYRSHCGKLQKWGDYYYYQIEFEDGRDSQGRFSKTPKWSKLVNEE